MQADFYERLGWALKSHRKHKKVSQAEIAKVVGVTFQQIQKYESGDNRIPVDKLDDYCSYLGVKYKWMVEHAKGKLIES